MIVKKGDDIKTTIKRKCEPNLFRDHKIRIKDISSKGRDCLKSLNGKLS